MAKEIRPGAHAIDAVAGNEQGVSMRVRKMRVITIAIGVAASMWIGWSIFRATVLPARFERVAVGDSREQVVQLLGKPRSIEKCGEPFGNPGGKSGCKEDYL